MQVRPQLCRDVVLLRLFPVSQLAKLVSMICIANIRMTVYPNGDCASLPGAADPGRGAAVLRGRQHAQQQAGHTRGSPGKHKPPEFPSRLPSLLQAATSAGVLVVSCTQCSNGAVSGIYETGAALIDAGVIPGSDITPEAALTKLSWVKPKPKNLSRET